MIDSKKIWFKSLSVSLGLLFIFSSIGLSVDIHYCQGSIKSVGFYAAAEKCSSEMEVEKCDNHSEPSITKTPCCSNQQYFYQTGNAGESIACGITQNIPFLTILQDNGDRQHDKFLLENVLYFNGSDPPVIVKDLNILYDIFLV